MNKTAGMRRVSWNLTEDAAPPPPPAAGADPAGRGAGRGGAGGGGGRGGRGGAQGPTVAPGRYTATLGKLVGDSLTPIGPAQSFAVLPLPAEVRAKGRGQRAEEKEKGEGN